MLLQFTSKKLHFISQLQLLGDNEDSWLHDNTNGNNNNNHNVQPKHFGGWFPGSLLLAIVVTRDNIQLVVLLLLDDDVLIARKLSFLERWCRSLYDSRFI